MAAPDLITSVSSAQCPWAQQNYEQYYLGKIVWLCNKPFTS